MKIALVLNDDFSAWHFRRGLIRELRRRGARVWVVCPPGPYVPRLEGIGATHLPISLYRFVSPLRDLRLLVDLWRIFRRHRFDIVHTMTIKLNVYGALAARWAGVRRVVSLVSGLGYTFGNLGGLKIRMAHVAASTLYRLASRRTEKVWFQNPDDLRLMVRRGMVQPRKAVLIRGSGVDTEALFPGAVSERDLARRREELGMTLGRQAVLMLVARVVWSKGVREFVEASRQIARAGVDACFILVGPLDPDSPDAVPESYLRQHEGTSFRWLGFQERIEDFLGLADVVALPSYYPEGVPRSLLEAMAMGKPIVTTDNVGCREVIEDGCNGFRIPARRSDALAGALLRLLRDAPLRDACGNAARLKVEREFSEALVVRRVLEELYGWR